jgi:hypothetical protein
MEEDVQNVVVVSNHGWYFGPYTLFCEKQSQTLKQDVCMNGKASSTW